MDGEQDNADADASPPSMISTARPSSNRVSLDKLLFLAERAFRQGGKTYEAFAFELCDKEETTASDEESTKTRHTTAVVPHVFSPRSSRGYYEFTNHDYQNDALSFFLSVQIAQVAGILGFAAR